MSKFNINYIDEELIHSMYRLMFCEGKLPKCYTLMAWPGGGHTDPEFWLKHEQEEGHNIHARYSIPFKDWVRMFGYIND